MSREIGGNSRNPFFVEDYEGDSFSKGSKPYSENPNHDPFREDYGEYEDYQAQIQESMNRQMQGTKRCLAGIYESEQIGAATAEDLIHQGEQLDNIESKTDQVNQDLKTSARHITSIKSVFGSIKNWWNKEKAPTSRPDPVQSSKNSQLRQTLESPTNPSYSSRSQPGANDTQGFYEADVAAVPASRQTQEWKQYEARMDEDLDLMSGGITRLKQLGLGLGSEIDRQSEQLDRIGDKADRADTTLTHQNRDINKILKR